MAWWEWIIFGGAWGWLILEVYALRDVAHLIDHRRVMAFEELEARMNAIEAEQARPVQWL